jgi:hypothetical protein
MAFVVAIIARSKGHHPALWFLYGLLIWPIALVHILVAKRDEERLARWGTPTRSRSVLTALNSSNAKRRCASIAVAT